MHKIGPSFISLLLITMMITGSAFQVNADTSTSSSATYQPTLMGVRRSLATVIFCSIGGAVLGISTLSFYPDPQNHIGNISTGLALGLIGGGAYVGMQAMDYTPTALMYVPPKPPVPVASWKWDF